MDPGYELYLKLMTDFPLPNDQYEIMDCMSRVEDRAGLDTSVPEWPCNSQRLWIKTWTNLCPGAAERQKSSTYTNPKSTTTTQPQRRKPVIILSHDAWHVSVHYSLLREALESRGYPVVIINHPSANSTISPNAKTQDNFNRCRSVTLSHLIAGEDVVVVIHSFRGIMAPHAILGLGSDEIESRPDKPRGRILSVIYLCAFIPEFEGILEDVQEDLLPMQLTVNPARDVVSEIMLITL